MDSSRGLIQNFALRLFACLLSLYPPHFRLEFSAEIHAAFLSRLQETERDRHRSWLVIFLQEVIALLISILRERWHERILRKENKMSPEDRIPDYAVVDSSGGLVLQPSIVTTLVWVASWTVLATAVFPAAVIAMSPVAVIFMWMVNLGVNAGFWQPAHRAGLLAAGFMTCLALGLAAVQWIMLRRFLPGARHWFIVTGTGLLISGPTAMAILSKLSAGWQPELVLAAWLLPVGLALGMVQWLYLRRFLPNASWIILIDGLAFFSLLPIFQSFTNLSQIAVILMLPGAISAVGMWFLLMQPPVNGLPVMREEPGRKRRLRISPIAWACLFLVALVPLYFGGIWAYAASQLALAKNDGVYPTPEAAILATNSQGWGGAKVIRVEGITAEQEVAHPQVWFGRATVYLDRIPEGLNKDYYHSGTFYIHVRDGWVQMPEGTFPEFIGWVMELYGMEEVHH
ncbi:MAG: hypothetical protein ACM3PY_21620 [Omnitrophica WOR_2 bacterium]